MSRLVIAAAAAFALALPGTAPGASSLRLDLSNYGEGARAFWKAQIGQPDPTSNNGGDHALVMEKRTSSAAFGGAVAEVEGIGPIPVRDLAKVQWNRRSDTRCTESPRWELAIDGNWRVVLGCFTAPPANGNLEGWSLDHWGADAIAQKVVEQAGEAALDGTLTGLRIVFDEGPAQVVLDNIIVTTRTTEGRWYGPGS